MNERAERFSAGDVELEGFLHLPDGDGSFAGIVVCHPHPQYGGDMDNNVVMVLCGALVARGIAALRFNFRGVGNSTGSYEGGEGETADAVAAFAHLMAMPQIAPGRVGIAGYSFGALVGIAAAFRIEQTPGFGQPAAVALISVPVKLVQLSMLDCCETELLLTAGDRDWVTPADELRALAATRRGTELHIVPGADHSWWGHERELGEIAGRFFARHLGRSAG